MVNRQIHIIIQARTGSSRLPGKVLKELMPGRTMLSCMLERIQCSKFADKIIVATSTQPCDEPVLAEARNSGCYAFAGSEHDVLGRYVAAARAFESDVIVRLCADSPLHDAEIVDRCIDEFMRHSDHVDFVSNISPETFPYGTAVEVLPIDVLLRLDRLSNEPELREHVTLFIHRNPSLFGMLNVSHEEDLSKLRWAVDHAEDFELARDVYARLYKKDTQFSWLDVVALTKSARVRG